jgi:hypothetical protein
MQSLAAAATDPWRAPVTLQLVSATPLGPDGVLLLIYRR